MNLILVSNNSQEASTLKQEISRYISAVKIQTSLTIQDAFRRTSIPGAFDVVLIDTTIPQADCIALATSLKKEKNPIGIVVLSKKIESDPLTEQSNAPVDRFVLKRAGFVPILCDILQQIMERPRSESPKHERRMRLLYAGKTETIQPYLDSMPFLLLESISIAADGVLQLPESGTIPGDLVIIDQAATGDHTIKAIKDLALRVSDLPIILLNEPGNEDLAIQAIKAGAADCVSKNENFFQRLLPVIEREIRVRDLAREKEALKSKGERLRQIVEAMPVGVALIAPDGTFLAVNRAGLHLIGATRTDQVIGKNLIQMAPQEDRDAIHKFLSTVGEWTAASIRLNWKGIDGSIPGIEFRATPLLRDTKGAPAALSTIHSLGSETGDSSIDGEIQKRCDNLEKALREYEARFKDLQDKTTSKLSQWEEALQQAEARYQASEEQQAKLKEEVVFAESRLKQLIEEHAAERTEWEQINQSLREQATQIEVVAQTLGAAQENQSVKQALWDSQRLELEQKLALAESTLSQISETLRVQKAQYEQELQEFERKWKEAEAQRLALEAALHNAETRIAQQTEALSFDLSQRDLSQQELEQKFKNAEELRTNLEIALGEAETRLARQITERNEERAQFHISQEDLANKFKEAEEQRTALDSALKGAEERLALQAGERLAERAQFECLRLELEQKCREVEQQQEANQLALKEAESRLIQQVEVLATERSQWALIRSDLELKYRLAEEQRSTLQDAMNKADAGLTQQAEEHAAERAQWERIRQELEQNLQAADEERTALREALQKVEYRLEHLAEGKSSDLAQLESARKDLEQKLQAAEKQHSFVLAALQEEKSQRERLTSDFATERIQLETVHQQLEQKCREMEERCHALIAALQQKETDFALLSETSAAERGQQEVTLRNLEQNLQAAEGQRALLQSALREAEVRIAEFMERYLAEQAQQETALRELMQKYQATEAERSSLQTALKEATSRIAELTSQHNSEHSQLDTLRQEFDEKYQSAENHRITLQNALAEAESRIEQQKEKFNAEITQRALVQKELERKLQAADKQRASLQSALDYAESKLSHITEKHRAELSQYEFAQKKAEQKCQTVERQHAALQTELQEAASRLAQITETFNSEQAQWEQARAELEQRYNDAEKEHVVALQKAVREAESRLAWISEQNQAKAIQLESLQHELEVLRSQSEKLQIESTEFRLRYQKLSQIISAGIVVANHKGLVLECNDAAARMFGYLDAEEALSQSGDQPFRIYAFEGALNARLQQDGKLESIEWTAVGRDGRLVRIQENAAIVESSGTAAPLVERILTDITKTYKLSEEIRRVRRVESSGDLAAATVNSFQELCGSIAQSSKRILESSADDETVRRLAETALNDANRGIKYARQFLSVTQKTEKAPALHNLNEILISNDAMLHSLIGEDIDLQTSFEPRLGLISADQNEIVQLIGNLLANAREALPLGGVVSIETSNVELVSSLSEHPVELHPGIYVRMIFQIDGCALQPDRRTASIRMIVERLGGFLMTVNDAKLGNIHKIYLPRVESSSRQTDLRANSMGA